MDLQIIIMVIFFLFFGIVSIFANRVENKTFHYTYMIAISITLLILTVEAITNADKRYISLLFIIIGLTFLFRQLRIIKS